ncbi:hypothetical protein CS063_04495 [Sporanaerobium hydrogeniformans]|uniref:Uncharacterized protein n=1 Tax=Sporanaerobium hydrogeniformans TaxID=3072179 RepID=A0AC61DF59_9FIRM|nr:hypothetical protein [Sporanaerobium hydrogeniformans]PHV71821.1 hypothetical protein CS063_04495 [Sporanaerobium hydrogeniformans]
MPYLSFGLYCLRTGFRFFKYRPHQQARILEKKKLYFLAGCLYMRLENYIQAASCFKAAKAYRQLVQAYEALGLYSKAIEVAEKLKDYRLGAQLCERIGNHKKAAYFFSYFKPLYSAKLYKLEGYYYEAGLSYLKAYQFISAIECFHACSSLAERAQGLRQIEEIAVVLYFSHSYEESFRIFFKLKDYFSALECAKKLREKKLIESTQLLLAYQEEQMGHYLLAGKYYEPFNPPKALTCYYLGHHIHEALHLLIEQGAYAKAVNLCIQHNELAAAYELINTYKIPLEPSLALTYS